MAKKTKSWTEKMQAKPPHTVRLDKDFAGVPSGSILLISNPQSVADYLFTLKRGEQKSVQQMRRELALEHDADATCPVSTGIFLRVVAEYAWEQLQAGTPTNKVPPFWRVISAVSPTARKLSFDPLWIAHQRENEGIEEITGLKK